MMKLGPRPLLPTERTMIQGIAAARWAVWAWLCITAYLQREDLRHPLVALGAIVIVLSWTSVCTVMLRRHPEMLMSRHVVLTELILAWSLLLVDGWVFKAGHSFQRGQSLAGNWPLIAVLFAATALGPWWGGSLAAVVGTGRLVGGLVNGVPEWTGERIVSAIATIVFYAIGALVWGFVTRRLRTVENEVAMVRARDEVARTLHDGVLQTLALVERRTRTSDPELALVARRSDRELRSWLFHGNADDVDDVPQNLAVQLHRVADRISQTYDLSVTVSVVDDDDHALNPDVMAAVIGAVGEALTNTAKHAEATRVVVFGEVDEEGILFVSVRDDGCGFDVSRPSDRRGLEHSVRRRMADVGGRVEIVSEPTKGTEVRLWSK